MKNLFAYLFSSISIISLSQVGVNTETPTETLDINGTLRIRNIKNVGSDASAKDSIMVFDKGGVIKRASAKQIFDQIDLSSIINERQQLTLKGNTLKLDRSSQTIDLNKYLDNTDSQQLKYDNDKKSLSLTGGGTANLSALDSDKQQLSLKGNTLKLERGGSLIDLSNLKFPKYISIQVYRANEGVKDGVSESYFTIPYDFNSHRISRMTCSIDKKGDFTRGTIESDPTIKVTPVIWRNGRLWKRLESAKISYKLSSIFSTSDVSKDPFKLTAGDRILLHIDYIYSTPSFDPKPYIIGFGYPAEGLSCTVKLVDG